jgi:hypothetical protein
MHNLKDKDVEWVVNDMAELGVKIGDQCFFVYKGRSYNGGKKYRHIHKREFGETCSPINMNIITKDYVGYRGEDESEWKDIDRVLSCYENGADNVHFKFICSYYYGGIGDGIAVLF